MTTAQTAFDAKVVQKINKMMPYLIKTANGDEDLIQEGAIGIWQSMTKKPDASDQYYANKAKWNIKSVARGVGKSLDIPKWHKRKTPITIVHHDAVLSQPVLADRKRLPLDDYVINKVDFDNFINKLFKAEAKLVSLKMVDELADGKIADKLGRDLWHVKCLKKKLRDKITDHFAE